MLLSLTAQILLAAPASCHAPVSTAKSHVSSEYGPRVLAHFDNFKHNHLGIDFVAEKGTPVKSVLNGRVLGTRNDSFRGKMILVRSVLPGRKYLDVFYTHLDTITAKEGDLVFAGEKIGTVGSTGTQEGPHLHLSTMVYVRDTGSHKFVPPRSVINFCKYEYRHHDYSRGKK